MSKHNSDHGSRGDQEMTAMAPRRASGSSLHSQQDVKIVVSEEPKGPAKVYLDGDEGRFWYPGQTVVGQVRCKPGVLQPDSEPEITLQGSIRVRRIGEIGLGQPDSILVFCRRNVAKMGNLERHPEHEDTFRFKIRIPEFANDEFRTPPSCHFTGDLYWECEVQHALVVNFPQTTHEELTVPLQVRTSFTEDEERSFPDIHEEEQDGKVMTLCCISRGEFQAKLILERSHYLTGGSVQLKADLYNHSGRDVKGVRFAIEARFEASQGTDRRADTISLVEVELERQRIPKATDDGPTHRRVEVSLRIPRKSPPTFKFGDKLSVRHVALVETLYESAIAVQVEYPVALGLSHMRRLALADESDQSDAHSETHSPFGSGLI
eukprot:Hpha_TRINITY_DN27164_c0_g1::TRINITY_DN27164_c0_g1_i1::g.29404::m.29404